MAEFNPPGMEELVQEKVEEELNSLSQSRSKDLTKTAKDVIEIMLPEITKETPVAVTAAATSAEDRAAEAVKTKTLMISRSRDRLC